MWVQLKCVKRIERRGKQTTYRPGDWVDVGKQLALRWINQGEASVPDFKIAAFINEYDTGVLVTSHHKVGATVLGDFVNQISIEYGTLRLPWTYTLIWNPQQVLRRELVPVGFHLLETWQVACPLLSYEKLANTVGSGDEQKRTKDVIHDLRVPLYNPSLIFVKRCDDTQHFIDTWTEESMDSTCQELALLRAIYKSRPLILALPATWGNPKMRGDEI